MCLATAVSTMSVHARVQYDVQTYLPVCKIVRNFDYLVFLSELYIKYIYYSALVSPGPQHGH